MTNVYTPHNTTPRRDTMPNTKWSSMWHWTTVLCQETDDHPDYETRMTALENMVYHHDDDTRDHLLAALRQCLRIEYDPRIRTEVIMHMVELFPSECDITFWLHEQRRPEDRTILAGARQMLPSVKREHAVRNAMAEQAQQEAAQQEQEIIDKRAAHIQQREDERQQLLEWATLTVAKQQRSSTDMSAMHTVPAVEIDPNATYTEPDIEPEQSKVDEYGLEATINWEDGKLRLYANERLDKDDFDVLMEAGFNWVRGDTIFYAAYTPSRETVLVNHFGIEVLLDDDTDMRALAEDRADRYEEYSKNAGDRAQEHREISDNATRGIPMGQPVLVGHHSEKRHRAALKRSDTHMRKYVDASERADYWARRAEKAIARQDKRETTAAISKRIARLEADQRKYERQLEDAPDSDYYQQWLWFTNHRLDFERALLDAKPDDQQPLTSDDIEKGGAFRDERGGLWYPISKVARVNVYYHTFDGIRLKVRIDTLTSNRYLSPDEFDAAIAEGRMTEQPGNAYRMVDEPQCETDMGVSG